MEYIHFFLLGNCQPRNRLGALFSRHFSEIGAVAEQMRVSVSERGMEIIAGNGRI
jgi:hypothetical protein